MFIYARVPGFYAEVERRTRPALQGRALIVGGDPRKRGTVQSASREAQRAGVAPGMPMLEALDRCPDARALRTNMRLYREVSANFQAVFRQGATRVEAAGLGAVYLDVSGREEAPERIASGLRARVAEALQLPLEVGVAPIKFLAKIAAESAEREGFFCVQPHAVQDFLRALPAARLPGVGPRTERVFEKLGVRTVGDLRARGREQLEAELGRHGAAIFDYALGRDIASVRRATHPRSLSQQATFETAELDRQELGERMGELALRLERALAREGLVARRVVLKVRYADGAEPITRSNTLPRALRRADELRARADILLARTDAGRRAIRGLGLAVHLLRRRGDQQPELFDFKSHLPEGER